MRHYCRTRRSSHVCSHYSRSGLNEMHPRSTSSCLCFAFKAHEKRSQATTFSRLSFLTSVLCFGAVIFSFDYRTVMRGAVWYIRIPYPVFGKTTYPDVKLWTDSQRSELFYVVGAMLVGKVCNICKVRLPALFKYTSQYNRRCRTKSILQAKEMSAVVPVVAPVSCLLAVQIILLNSASPYEKWTSACIWLARLWCDRIRHCHSNHLLSLSYYQIKTFDTEVLVISAHTSTNHF